MASANGAGEGRARSSSTAGIRRRQRKRIPSLRDIKRSFSSLRRGNNTPRIQIIVVLGDVEVGKTCILSRMLYDFFSTDYEPTMEDMHDTKMNIRGMEECVQLLDTNGDPTEEVRSLRRSAINRGNAFVVVFNVKHRPSFIRAAQILDEIMEISNAEGRDLTKSTLGSGRRVVLVGNQADEVPEDDGFDENMVELCAVRQVRSDEAWDLADEYGIEHYLEVSAMTGLGVDSIPKRLSHLYQRRQSTKGDKDKDASTSTLMKKMTSFLHRDGRAPSIDDCSSPRYNRSHSNQSAGQEKMKKSTSPTSASLEPPPPVATVKPRKSFLSKFSRNRRRSTTDGSAAAKDAAAAASQDHTSTVAVVYHVAL